MKRHRPGFNILEKKSSISFFYLYLLLPSFFHSFVRSFVPSFLRSFVRSFVSFFVLLFISLFIRSIVHSFISSFVPSFLRFILRVFVRAFVPLFFRYFLLPFVPIFVRSFIRSFPSSDITTNETFIFFRIVPCQSTNLFHCIFHWSKHHWISFFDLVWSFNVFLMFSKFGDFPLTGILIQRYKKSRLEQSLVRMKSASLTQCGVSLKTFHSKIIGTDYIFQIGNVLSRQKSWRLPQWYKMCSCAVGLYGIPTIIGYLMPNHVYTYILDIYELLPHFVDNFSSEPKILFCAQLNGFMYCYLIRIIPFIINHLLAHS